VFRLAAREGGHYVPLGMLSKKLWHELGEACEHEILRSTGGIMIGRAESVIVSGTMASAKEHNLEHETLTAQQLRKRFPQHVVADDDIGVADPSAGILRPELAITQAIRLAVEHGAQIVTGVRVSDIAPDDDGVTIRTSAGQFRVGETVIAAGAWTRHLLPKISSSGQLNRVVMTWFRPRAGAASHFDPDRFPIFVRALPDGAGLWGLGALDGPLVKIGTHGYVAATDPDRLDRAVYPEDVEAVTQYVRQYLPGLDPNPAKMQPCMIATSADDDFVLGAHPHLPHVTVLAGLGGHGFKYAAGIGEVAAGLLLDGRSPVPVDGFSPSRLLNLA